MTRAPDLSKPEAWEANGSGLTAWISGTEVLEISPRSTGNRFSIDGFQLTANDVVTARTKSLGWFSRLTTAQRIANEYAQGLLGRRSTP